MSVAVTKLKSGIQVVTDTMPHLNEADLVLPFAEGLDDAVDAVAGDTEHGVDTPGQQGFDQNVAGGRLHRVAF